MKKVKISISVNSVYFSFTTKENDDNLNLTSYVETGNLTFEYDYIKNNTKIMTSFIKDITNQTKINTIKIKNLELVPIVLKIVKNNNHIKKLHVLDNKIIDTNSFLAIIDNKNLNYLNCYSMPTIMFNYINSRKDILIEFRSKFNTNSDFLSCNKLNKYSIIYYKKSINIESILTDNDIHDLDAFLLINQNLQTINIKKYDLNTLIIITKLLAKYKKTKIRINIYQNKNDLEEIFKDSNEIKKLKSKDLKIKIIYNKDYIVKNFFKQINISLLRFSFLGIFIALIIVFSITKYTSCKEDNETSDIVNDINDIINETEIIEDAVFDDIEEEIVVESPTESNNKKKNNKPNAYKTKYEKVFAKLKEINQDTIGWLTVKNTSVDYPVVQYTDNDYYLSHSFDNKKNSRGWIFADYRNNFNNLNDNTIIYGHNLKSGFMFGTLQKVLAPEWYNNIDNRTIIFNTEQNDYNWQIFSIYTIEKNNDYLVSTFANETNFNNYIKLSKERSIIDFGIDVKYGDNILTLSTCYKDSDHRLIIQAKLIK